MAFAQNADRGLGDSFTQLFILSERDVDGVLFGIPFSAIDNTAELRYGVIKTGVDTISAKDKIAYHTVVELHDVLDGFGTEPGVFLVHLIEDVLQRKITGRFELTDLIVFVVDGYSVVD